MRRPSGRRLHACFIGLQKTERSTPGIALLIATPSRVIVVYLGPVFFHLMRDL
jgi:hypothetical protein